MYVRSAVPPIRVHVFNDVFVLEGAMRVIVTARQTLTPGYERTLQRLVGILGVISKNPSNPNFDQFIFESISALMRYELFLWLIGAPLSSLTYLLRFVVSGSPATLPTFEQALFGPFTIIIQQEIEREPVVLALIAPC